MISATRNKPAATSRKPSAASAKPSPHPDNAQAAINLGALLFNKGKIEAAAYWLERGIASIDSARRTAVRQIIADSEPQPNPLAAAAHLHVVPHRDVQ